MEWLDDSRACLDISEMLLGKIEEMIPESIQNAVLIPYIKVKIKNCLENCRSPLDYAAQFIFDEYCRVHFIEKEKKKPEKKQNLDPNIYYPVRDSVAGFEQAINYMFFPLKETKPEIIELFKRGQLFSDPNNPFLHTLNSLTNENKHRNLTKHEKEQTTHVKNIRFNGVTIGELIAVNTETPLQIGDTKMDFIKPSRYDHIYDEASVKIEYFFADLKLSVIPALESIYSGANSIINELEKVIEGK